MNKVKQVIITSALIVTLTPIAFADLNTPVTANVVVDLSNNKTASDELSEKQVTGIGYEFFAEAMLVQNNSSDFGETLGLFKVAPDPNALPADVNANSLVITPFADKNMVVKRRGDDTLGLADGALLIKPKFISDREVIIQQYGLEVTSVLAGGQFFTARVTDISDLPSVFSALLANPLVEEVDLNVNYFDQAPH